MSETRNGRRTSARIADKEEAPLINGFGHSSSQAKDKTPGKPPKNNKTVGATGAIKATREKRKQGMSKVEPTQGPLRVGERKTC